MNIRKDYYTSKNLFVVVRSNNNTLLSETFQKALQQVISYLTYNNNDSFF